MLYPKSFQKLIREFSALPSVGPKMAERLVLYLFKQDKEKLEDFSQALLGITILKSCQKCFNIAEGELCAICADTKRAQASLCVVEEPLDIIAIEKTSAFTGRYHVLGGVLEFSSGENNGLKIPELMRRIQDEQISEVIIATNPTTEGDTTALYLKRKIAPLNIKVTRLAKGMATGGDIEYADEATLSAALTNRREML